MHEAGDGAEGLWWGILGTSCQLAVAHVHITQSHRNRIQET